MARVKCPKCFTVNPDAQERCVQCGAPLPRIKISGPAPQAPQAPPPGQGPAASGQFQPGQTFAQRYTVISLIGRGGMGCIYRVKDNTLNEEVALKTLLPQFVRDKMVVERFFNEARIARKLAHPNIVRVHDIGSSDGIVYISMEYVPGQSMRNLMERLPQGQRLLATEVLRIAEDLCVALEYAHQYTIHRDIKPENIMVDAQGRVKLMDFGISKLMANTRMTGASVVMGTPFYMSPEQLRNSRDVDARADVFSVGVVLYETLTGAVPTGVPKPPSVVVPGLPRRVDEIVGKCVEPDPAKRYQNASELRAAIRALRQEIEMGGPPVVTPVIRRTTLSLPPNLFGWALSGAMLVATLAAVYWVEQRAAAAQLAVPVEATAAAVPDALTLAGRLREKAQTISGGQEQQRIFADAERNWNMANSGGGDAAAQAALRGYAAVLMAPKLPEMSYIPGGVADVGGAQVTVPAFFIDRLETTHADFAAFCSQNNWRENCKEAGEYAAYPVTNVAYYDAQAFAASKNKRLPSAAEWSRAAQGDDAAAQLYPWEGDFDAEKCNCEGDGPVAAGEQNGDLTPWGCAHMLGNVSEWTRSSTGGTDDPPDFSSEMIVRGGSYATGETTLSQQTTLPYGAFREDLGFRCAKEIPTAANEVEALLQ